MQGEEKLGQGSNREPIVRAPVYESVFSYSVTHLLTIFYRYLGDAISGLRASEDPDKIESALGVAAKLVLAAGQREIGMRHCMLKHPRTTRWLLMFSLPYLN